MDNIKEELQGVVDKGIEKVTENLVSKEVLNDELETIKSNLTEAVKDAVKKGDLDEVVEKIEKGMKDLDDKLFAQGQVKSNESQKNMKVAERLIKGFADQFETEVGDEAFNVKSSIVDFTIKAGADLTHTYGEILDTDGVTVLQPGVDAATQTWFSQAINDIAENPRESIAWLNSLNTLALERGQLHIVELCNEEGDAECVAECEVKPLAKITPQTTTAECCTIAVRFKISRKFRKHFGQLLGRIQQSFTDLVRIKAQKEIFDRLFANGVTFQNLGGCSYTEPTLVDLINSKITEFQMMNVQPNTVFLNYADYNKMRELKATDGHYQNMCCGGGEIMPFHVPLNIVRGNFVPKGSMYIGDLSKAYIGVQNGIDFVQGFEDDDLKTNVITNVIETDIAVLVPTCHQVYFMACDIAAGKTLITA